MGILYRYDYIEEGYSEPIVLSFRLTMEIPEYLYEQLLEHLDPDEPPSNCFLSQLFVKKIEDTCYLFITVNLLSFYAKWSDTFNYSYKDIVNLLKEKISNRFGEQFADYFISDEKLDCDFIEYAFITRGRDVIRDMLECHASSEQVTKTYWEDYLRKSEKIKEAEEIHFLSDKEELIDFLSCCIEYNHSEFAKSVDTNSLESYNSCHKDFYEAYVRCKGFQLKRFFGILGKNDYICKRGVLLKALFDGNYKRTLCQCAYEENCNRRCSTGKTAKALYEEFCKEFGN